MTPVCHVIPRVIPSRRRTPHAPSLGESENLIELFLPADPVNVGMIGVWGAEGHAEASTAYYRATRPARTPREVAAAAVVVKRYAAWMRSIPLAERQSIVVRERRTAADRRAAWS